MIVRGGESIVTPDDRQGAGRNTQVSVHVSVNGPNGVSESNSLRSHSVMLASICRSDSPGRQRPQTQWSMSRTWALR